VHEMRRERSAITWPRWGEPPNPRSI
jgi:hypothetical protein